MADREFYASSLDTTYILFIKQLFIEMSSTSYFLIRIAIITKDGVERKLFLNNELDAIGEFSY